MIIKKLFDSLDNEEKELIGYYYAEYCRDKIDKEESIEKSNSEFLHKWSSGMMSPRLKTALLKHFKTKRLVQTDLQQMNYEDVIRIRNIGNDLYKEFVKYQISNSPF